MPARTPVPVKMVTAPVRAIRGGGRGPGKELAVRPSAELVEIQHLRREIAVMRGDAIAPDEVELASWLYRHRKQLAPVYVALILAASKVLVLAPSFLPVLGLGALLVLAAGGVLWARACSSRPWRAAVDAVPIEAQPWVARVVTPRTAAVLACICALFWWVRPAGPKEAAWSAGLAVAVAVVARAYRFRIRPTVVETRVMGPRELWVEHVPAGDKHLQQAHVTGPRDVISPKGDRIGFALAVTLPPGSPPASTYAAAVGGRTGTTFGVGAGMDVVVGLDARNAARFDVTVLDVPGSSALDHIHRYEGSTFDTATGTFRLGYRADWSPALVQIYDPKHGARHGHLSGETGGGKSATLELILRNATSSGVIVPLVVDIAQTLGDWADRAPVYVTTREQAVQLLRNIETLHDHRMSKMRDMRMIVDGRDAGARKVYPVDAAHPMYLIPFDEWAHHVKDHKVDPVSRALLAATEAVVTQTRKTMEAMLLVGQATGLILGFGNNQNIRTQCQAGYMGAHRNNNESGRQVFGNGLGVDPSTIPMGLYGAAFAASVVDQTDSMCRTEWVEHPGLFDHEVDIPAVPEDELEILKRGLPGGMPLDATVIDVKPAAAKAQAPAPAPFVEAPPSDALMDAIEFWLAEVGDAVQRKDVITEFRDGRGMGSSTKIDAALKRLREREIVEAEDGKYRARVRTTQ
jgi:hypothetical protein